MLALQKAQEKLGKPAAKGIPDRFLNPDTSNLTVTVTPNQDTTFNVDIK
jgi:hypothetical protein